jgi:L-ribulose-5-phosphate 3-epimerase
VILLKIGVNQWMFPADLPPEECFRVAKAAGADGVELNISYDKGLLTLQQPLDYYHHLAEIARSFQMQVTSVLPAGAWENLAKVEPNTPAADVVCMRLAQMCDITKALGTDTILLVPGSIGDGTPRYDIAWRNSTAIIKRMETIAAAKGIYLAIENIWSKFILSPMEMRQFIDQFESGYIKAYFDVGNVLLYGFPEHWIEILGPRIQRVHLKDFRRSVANGGGFVGLLEGDVNWTAVIAALKTVGYDGFVTAELSRPAQQWQAFLAASCAIMRTLTT